MSDNIPTNLLQEHYTQVQVYLSIIADKGLDCLNVRTEINGDKAYTSINMSAENFAIFTKGKEVVIRPGSISHSIVSEIDETCTRMNHITLSCFLNTDDLSVTTKMDKDMVASILEDTNFSFDSKLFSKGE